MDTSYTKWSDGKLIKAKSGTDKTLPFFCPGCSHEVYVATEGSKQRPHFRHKSLDGLTGCSEPESYIHWVTKSLFAEEYQKTDVFYLTRGVQKKCVHKLTVPKVISFESILKKDTLTSKSKRTITASGLTVYSNSCLS